MAFGAVVLLFACIIQPNVVYGDEPELTNLDQCPYNDFCTRNRTKTDELPSGYKPCCPTCYCDTMCFQFRDCCPDVDVTSRPVAETVFPVCLPPFHLTEHTQATIFPTKAQGFLQKRRCPVSYMSTSTDPDRLTNKYKCERNSELENLDEHLLVSNRNQPTEVFGNKYCAACNGVNDTIQWNLKVHSCGHQVIMDRYRPAIDLFPETLVYYCYLESIPPDDLQSLERIKCWLNQPYESTCDLHSQWASSSQGERIKEACEQSTYEQVFIDNDASGNESTIFANYKCYLCENGPDKTPGEICEEEAVMNNLTYGTSPTRLTIMLDGSEMLAPWSNLTKDTPAWISSSERCDDLYDEYMDRCVSLDCPGHTGLVDGQCIPIGQSIFGVAIPLMIRFFVQSISTMNRPDETHGLQTMPQLAQTLGITESDIDFYVLTKFYDKFTENVICIILEFLLSTSSEHPVGHAVEIATELLDKEIEWNVAIDEFVYRLSGRVAFLDPNEFCNTNKEDDVVYGNAIPGPPPDVFKKGMYVCPHIVYKAGDYCLLQELLYATPCSSGVYGFEIDSTLMEGFFLLTPHSFGICTETLKKYLSNAPLPSCASSCILSAGVLASLTMMFIVVFRLRYM